MGNEKMFPTNSSASFAGVLVVGVARDADDLADLPDAVVRIALEGQGSLAFLLIDTLGSSALNRCRFLERGGQDAIHQYDSRAKPNLPDGRSVMPTSTRYDSIA